MKTAHHYVVLRLAPDQVRGELINVGVVLFKSDEEPQVISMAPLNKLRAIDAKWDVQRLSTWTENIRAILRHKNTVKAQVDALSMFGFCERDAVGMFRAETREELNSKLQALRVKYVSSKATKDAPPRERRTRLQKALRDQFRSMQVLGTRADDLKEHLVVPNVRVPGYDELKNDFVYKNGVYRITQTIDYNVSPDGLHSKLAEACVKSTAADLAVKAYGDSTMRMAVVDIPESLETAVDSHVGLLIARGFEVYHFGDSASMAAYLQKATPANNMLS